MTSNSGPAVAQQCHQEPRPLASLCSIILCVASSLKSPHGHKVHAGAAAIMPTFQERRKKRGRKAKRMCFQTKSDALKDFSRRLT